MEERPDPTQATKDWIDLKFSNLRSEMRLLFVVSVAGSQVLNHLSLTPFVAAVVNGGLIVGAVLLKTIALR